MFYVTLVAEEKLTEIALAQVKRVFRKFRMLPSRSLHAGTTPRRVGSQIDPGDLKPRSYVRKAGRLTRKTRKRYIIKGMLRYGDNPGPLPDFTDIPRTGKGSVYDRGHLIGWGVGGSNSELKNFAPVHYHLNRGKMRDFEMRYVKKMAERGKVVDYKVTAIFEGDDVIPRYIEQTAVVDGRRAYRKWDNINPYVNP